MWETHVASSLVKKICILGRYHVDEMVQDSREDCYKSTLHVNGVDSADSRPYYLVVENERGADRHAVTLRVDGEFTGARFRQIAQDFRNTYIKTTSFAIAIVSFNKFSN